MQHALRFPLEGWPPYELGFPLGDPIRTAGYPIFALGLRGMLPSKTLIRGEADDPLSVAPKATGAKTALPRDFRVMGAEGQLEFPLLPRIPASGN